MSKRDYMKIYSTATIKDKGRYHSLIQLINNVIIYVYLFYATLHVSINYIIFYLF